MDDDDRASRSQAAIHSSTRIVATQWRDEQCDEPLRALARLLARQAAREIFERESRDTREDYFAPEDLQ